MDFDASPIAPDEWCPAVIVRPKVLRTFSPSAVAVRLCAVMFVVLSTYNPSGASYVHWLQDRWPEDWMLLVPVAVVYGFVYFFLAQTTVRALHAIGIGLTIAVLGSLVWVLVDVGVLVLSGLGDVATLASLYVRSVADGGHVLDADLDPAHRAGDRRCSRPCVVVEMFRP